MPHESASTAIEITTKFELITDNDDPFVGQWRLRMWVSGVDEGIPTEIFVWQEIPPTPYYEEVLTPNANGNYERFVHIASYADIFAFPAQATDDCSPFFRRTYLDICSENKKLLEDSRKLGLKHVQSLVSELNRINNLVQEVIEVVL